MPTLPAGVLGLRRFGCDSGHRGLQWGPLCGLGLLGLQVGRSQWGRNLTPIRGKVYILPLESAKVHIGIQE